VASVWLGHTDYAWGTRGSERCVLVRVLGLKAMFACSNLNVICRVLCVHLAVAYLCLSSCHVVPKLGKAVGVTPGWRVVVGVNKACTWGRGVYGAQDNIKHIPVSESWCYIHSLSPWRSPQLFSLVDRVMNNTFTMSNI